MVVTANEVLLGVVLCFGTRHRENRLCILVGGWFCSIVVLRCETDEAEKMAQSNPYITSIRVYEMILVMVFAFLWFRGRSPREIEESVLFCDRKLLPPHIGSSTDANSFFALI